MSESKPTGPGKGRAQRLQIEVSAKDAGERLDVFLTASLAREGLSRAKVQALIKAGQVLLDGAPESKPGLRLAAGQSLEVEISPPQEGVAGTPGELEVVFADEHLVVVNKPAGLTVHPAPGEPGPTLVNLLVHRYPGLSALDPERPGIVHRIDKDTSGLLAVALTEKARLAMAAMFAERDVNKVYLAVCFGAPKPLSGRIEAAIGRDPSNPTRMAVAAKGGRAAVSEYEALWTSPDRRFSLLSVRILTGRTHQIRVHLAHIGHPLAGDLVYGPRENAEWARERGADALPPRQMLHAWRLGFEHPETGAPLSFGIKPPRDFMDFLARQAHEPLRVGVVGLPGSGKSALAGMLFERGVPVFSADEAVSGLYQAGGDGAALISGRFGGRYNDASGAVDKKALFEAMTRDDAVRREVMDLVHPLVKHALGEFWRGHARAEVAAAEVPLLLEVGWQGGDQVDIAVCVSAPDKYRRKRLMSGRGWTEEAVARMESWQWSGDKKAAACDLVVDNSGGMDELEREADKLYARLMAEAEKRRKARLKYLARLTDPGEHT